LGFGDWEMYQTLIPYSWPKVMCISPISANACFAQNKWSPTTRSHSTFRKIMLTGEVGVGGGVVAAFIVEALQCISHFKRTPPNQKQYI